MAHAIVYFNNPSLNALDIYLDLLNCDFEKWVNDLEDIASKVEYSALYGWMDRLKFTKGVWQKGDELMLTERAWKLKSERVAPKKGQLSIFDFLRG